MDWRRCKIRSGFFLKHYFSWRIIGYFGLRNIERSRDRCLVASVEAPIACSKVVAGSRDDSCLRRGRRCQDRSELRSSLARTSMRILSHPRWFWDSWALSVSLASDCQGRREGSWGGPESIMVSYDEGEETTPENPAAAATHPDPCPFASPPSEPPV